HCKPKQMTARVSFVQSGASDLRHLEAVVVVRRHLFHQIDFPGEVGAHGALAITTLLSSGKPDIIWRFGHAIVARRERISSHGPSTRPASERLYRQRGRSSELCRRDMGEVAVGGSEHNAFRRSQLLESRTQPRAGCEPGAGNVAVSIGL